MVLAVIYARSVVVGMTNRITITAALTTFALFIAGITYVQQASPTVTVPASEGGQFIFRNLRVSLVSSLLTWTVEGEVINRTSKHWATARFIFFVYDGGTKITEADFELRDFEKGASRKLELPSDLLAVEPSTAVRYEIHFAFGEPAPELSPSTIAVPVPGGKFTFRNLRLFPLSVSAWQLEGEVVNQTNKNWKSVEFTVRARTAEGMLEGTLTFEDFAQNSVRKFELPEVSVQTPDTSLKPTIAFKTGVSPARYVFMMIKPTANRNLVFEDANINIEFVIVQKGIGFTLRNRTEVPITVDWSKASCVGIDGVAYSALPSLARQVQTVPSEARIETAACFLEFPDAPQANALKGKSFGIFLPLQIGKSMKDYNFIFRIQDVEP